MPRLLTSHTDRPRVGRCAPVLALALLVATAAPAAAADGSLLAGAYWSGFVDFWTGAVKKQNGIVLLTLGVGAVCLFILTRSKAKKG